MTVGELERRMSSRELTEWKAYYELDPFGEDRADLRQAITTSVISNGFQGFSKSPKRTKPTDFMPFHEEPEPEEPTPEELRSKMMAALGRKR